MIIKFTNYADGIHELDFHQKSAELGLSKQFFGDVDIYVKMDKSFHQIVLSISVDLHAKLQCDRCTKEYEEDINLEFSSIYLFEQNDKDDDTEVHFLTPDDDKIDIRPDVLDYAELSLPMKKLCDDDCKGICSGCGVDLNENECKCGDEKINPVWTPLLKLKDKSDKK